LNTGLGALTDSSRFEQARGFGVFIRVLDLFHLIILAYGTILVLKNEINWIKKYSIIFGLTIFLIFSSLLGGAKFAFLEGLYVIAVSIYAYGKSIKLSLTSFILLMSFATAFALLVLNLNARNDISDTGVYNDDGNQLVQKFAARILANGDSYYGSLPNNVIDNLKVDNVFIRFIAPVIGISQMSKIVGYNVENYSVGRAILLFHDPGNDVSGGPVSHFDLFAYVYFGWFGIVFIVIMVVLVTSISNAIKKAPSNIFYISVLSALWVRCLPILLEPPMGFAYIFDAILLIFSIKLASYFIEKLILLGRVKS
jgi:hypothetical protein